MFSNRPFQGANPFKQSVDTPRQAQRDVVRGVLGAAGKRVHEKLTRRATIVKSSEPDMSFLEHETAEKRFAETAREYGETLENYAILLEARELLGERYVHGVADAEATLGFRIDRTKVPKIPYTRIDFEKSRRIEEETGVKEMLILCVGEDQEGNPITIENLEKLVQSNKVTGKRKLLREDGNRIWFGSASFFHQESLRWEWRMVTTGSIPGALNRPWEHDPKKFIPYGAKTQQNAIYEYCDEAGLYSDSIQRPTVVEMLYLNLVHGISTERTGEAEWILAGQSHRTASEVSYRYLGKDMTMMVYVGVSGTDGAMISRATPDFTSEYMGVFLARDPFVTRDRPLRPNMSEL